MAYFLTCGDLQSCFVSSKVIVPDVKLKVRVGHVLRIWCSRYPASIKVRFYTQCTEFIKHHHMTYLMVNGFHVLQVHIFWELNGIVITLFIAFHILCITRAGMKVDGKILRIWYHAFLSGNFHIDPRNVITNMDFIR